MEALQINIGNFRVNVVSGFDSKRVAPTQWVPSAPPLNTVHSEQLKSSELKYGPDLWGKIGIYLFLYSFQVC
jgi:hypothetical protein